MATTVNTIKNQRTALKRSATRIENDIKQILAETSINEMKGRLEQLEKIYEKYEALNVEMYDHEEDFLDHENELEEFEQRYFEMKTRPTEYIDSKCESSPNTTIKERMNS